MPVMGQPAPFFLATGRLGFRTWGEADLPLALALWGDPQVTRLIGGPFSEAQVRERLEREIATQRSHRIQYWPFFLLAGGEFIGCAGVRPYRTEENVLELGVHLCSAFWGRGYAREAAQAVIGYAFTELGASGLFAGHHPSNTSSRILLEKLGFRFTHEELYPPTGLNHPSYFLPAPRRASGDAP